MAVWRRFRKILLILAAVALFVTALKLMQAGAQSFAPIINEHLNVESPTRALGFGWAASYLLLSGSPVAAMAVTFYDSGEIDETAAFAMITGSRLGAAFVVLLIGFLFAFYRREPMRDLRIGLLALIVTASIYVPALPLGFLALELELFGALDEGTSALGEALEGGPVEQVAERAEEVLPAWGVFLAGLFLVMASLKLFEFGLPRVDADSGEASGIRHHVYRRWSMFVLGAAITLVSLSVTISLSLLVPLHDRRILHARHVVPYIMGANIATFVDTLVAAMTMKRGGAMVIVLVEMGAVAILSLLVLVFLYPHYERAMLSAVDLITVRRRNLAVFVALLVALPMSLLFLPSLAA
jgi:solute carrier family 34 (sodium-dependent phosphate cotransporter)